LATTLLANYEPALAPFGKVVEGSDVVEKLYGAYGENSGSGMRAGHQDKIFEGGSAYVDKESPKLDHLVARRLFPESCSDLEG